MPCSVKETASKRGKPTPAHVDINFVNLQGKERARLVPSWKRMYVRNDVTHFVRNKHTYERPLSATIDRLEAIVFTAVGRQSYNGKAPRVTR